MAAEEVHSYSTPDGTRIALHWQGPRTAPLTIVLAHGWTLDHRAWGPVADLLTAEPWGFRVLRYDHRGHGRSDPAQPGTATIAQLSDDLAGLLRETSTGPVVLAGHSMGGMAIMGLAERHPDLVAQRVVGVAFAASSCGEVNPLDFGLGPALARVAGRGENWVMRSSAVGHLLRSRKVTASRAGMLRAGVRWLLFGDRPRRADLDLTALCMAQGRPGNIVDFRPTFDDHDRAAALAAFSEIPALVLAGSRDRLIPLRHADALAAALPDATVVRYHGAGHMVLLERAEQVADRIGELARRAPADAGPTTVTATADDTTTADEAPQFRAAQGR